MPKHRLLWIMVLSVSLSLSFSRPVYAYIDPGTTGSIFAMLAPFIAIFLAFLGFLIRPFRMFFISLFYKLRGSSGDESEDSEEETESVDSPTNEESGENIGEDARG